MSIAIRLSVAAVIIAAIVVTWRQGWLHLPARRARAPKPPKEVRIPKQARIGPDEQVEFIAHRGAWPMFPLYALTLGLIVRWNRANCYIVTDQQIIWTKGLVNRDCRAIPAEMVLTANLSVIPGAGNVEVSSAAMPPVKMGPMPAKTARQLADAVLAVHKDATAQRRPKVAS